MKILFFGSTTDSVLALEALSRQSLAHIAAVVTQPPRPVGRTQTLTPTPVEIWAQTHAITHLTFDSDPVKPWLYKEPQRVIDTLQPIRADLLVSASYGQMIPWDTISATPLGGINIHPSILPHWRGADPVPWAILSGDHQAGVTVVTLSKSFDEGKILAQKKIPITLADTSDELRTRLFAIGADALITLLPQIVAGNVKGYTPTYDPALPYARKFKREDGFEPWGVLRRAMDDATDADRIERKFRALDPWPGVWTKITLNDNDENNSTEKRLKILQLHLDNGKLVLEHVQLEGKKPVTWEQFNHAYLPS